MWWCCGYTTTRKIVIEETHDIKRAEIYGITIERYKRILNLPNMNRLLMDNLYENGWDFADTKGDLDLFAEMQTYSPERKYQLETVNE
jgi:hypothetical protein